MKTPTEPHQEPERLRLLLVEALNIIEASGQAAAECQGYECSESNRCVPCMAREIVAKAKAIGLQHTLP